MLFSVLRFLEASHHERGNEVAVVDGETVLTFSQLRERVRATASVLKDLELCPGDRVGVCMAKSADQVVTILAILQANAIFVPILPALKRENIRHIVADSGMVAVITDSRRLEELTDISPALRLWLGGGPTVEALPNLAQRSAELAQVTAPAFLRLGVDIAAIIYSSGSTGRPKGIMVTHRNLADGAEIVASYLGTCADDRIAGVLSLNFDYGLNQLWQCLLTGASLHLHEFVLPNDLLEFLVREQITVLPVMPVLLARLSDSRFLDRSRPWDLGAIRYVCSSGGRLAPAMLECVGNLFRDAKFFAMYGLTEAFRSTYLPADQLSVRPDSIGRAIPDVEILVVDDAGNPCAPGVVGELVHRGGCVAAGYWNDPGRTAERFRQHASYPGEILVYSGDFVSRDSDGYLYFQGRKDGLLKCNGIRVSPTEIEVVAEQHLEVKMAVVFGVENPSVGHDIVLAYVTLNGAPVAEAALRAHLKPRLPSHMIPRHMVHLEAFPSTGNQGKVDRVAVQQGVLQALNLSVSGTLP